VCSCVVRVYARYRIFSALGVRWTDSVQLRDRAPDKLSRITCLRPASTYRQLTNTRPADTRRRFLAKHDATALVPHSSLRRRRRRSQKKTNTALRTIAQAPLASVISTNSCCCCCCCCWCKLAALLVGDCGHRACRLACPLINCPAERAHNHRNGQ